MVQTKYDFVGIHFDHKRHTVRISTLLSANLHLPILLYLPPRTLIFSGKIQKTNLNASR
jgi:hypothetical protein